MKRDQQSIQGHLLQKVKRKGFIYDYDSLQELGGGGGGIGNIGIPGFVGEKERHAVGAGKKIERGDGWLRMKL